MKGLFLVSRRRDTDELVWSGYDMKRKWPVLLRLYLIYLWHSVSLRCLKPRLQYNLHSLTSDHWELTLYNTDLLFQLDVMPPSNPERIVGFFNTLKVVRIMLSIYLYPLNENPQSPTPLSKHLLANKAVSTYTEPERAACAPISVNYLPYLPRTLHHQWRKPFEALISSAKLGRDWQAEGWWMGGSFLAEKR